MVNRRAECNGQPGESRVPTERRGHPVARLGFAAPALALAVAGAVAGCGADNPGLNGGPLDWWHGLQGGVIAEQRPPPPGADQPYPSLGTVPPRPTIPNPIARQQIAQGLVVDRAQAEQSAMANPLPPPGGAQPAPPSPPPAPAPNPNAASATLAAADTPPAPPQKSAPPPQPTPAAPPQAAPSPAVPSPGAPPPAASAQPHSGGQSAAATPPALANAADLPPIPTAPPPPPRIPGVAIPAVPTQPAPLPAPVVPPPSKPGESVWVPFDTGSAALSRDAAQSLRSLAARRHGAPIAITGHGDAVSDAPDAQATALSLALQRARAMADSLIADGIPASAVQIQANAGGRGGDARLVD